MIDTEKQIEFLKRYFEGLEKKISDARKLGLDTQIAEYYAKSIPHKIKFLEITKEKIDIKRLKEALIKLEREIPQSKE